MTASPTRRRRILQDQKYPSDFNVPRYTEAQEAIAAYLRRGARDERIIERAIDRLVHARDGSSWRLQANALCVDALKAFMNLAKDLDLTKYAMRQTGTNQPKLTKSGVLISAQPEITLTVSRNGRKQSSGVIRLYFSKTYALGMAAAYAGVILQEFAELHVSPLNTAKPRDCLLIDIFAEEVHVAPRSNARRRRELATACEEISAVWDSVREPANYNAHLAKSGVRSAKRVS